MTVREHLIAASRMGELGALADLNGPPLPLGCDHAWRMFWRLARTRDVGQAGILPIKHTEIRAFQRNTGTRLAPLDVLLIEEADDAFIAEFRERTKATVDDDTKALTDQFEDDD